MSQKKVFRSSVWLRGTLAACLMSGMGLWAFLAMGSSGSFGNAQELGTDTLTVWTDDLVAPLVPGAKVRTPESLTPLLIDDLVQHVPGTQVKRGALADTATLFEQARDANVLLTVIADGQALLPTNVYIPTGYHSGITAIMRSDTDITSWEALRGRIVCTLDQARYTGQAAARYGAVEKRFKAPADSLLALRTGVCDAAVHDSAMLQELVKLPEWKKFSAMLSVESPGMLAFVAPASHKTLHVVLQKLIKRWKVDGYLDQARKKAVQDIAFEVYLDQAVTDCH